MPFVADASVAVAWFFPDEDHPDAEAALSRTLSDEILVPQHWWYEVCNTMLLGERRRRFTPDDTGHFLARLNSMNVAESGRSDELAVLPLARRHRLTFYDAAYLELALREQLPLATLDGELAAAARTEGVALIGAD